jgi:hypothetical protein
MNLVVLSACYEKPELAAILTESCELTCLPLHFCQWSGSRIWPGSMRTGKLIAALEALQSLKADGVTHVMWADGFDCFVAPWADKTEIETRWHLLGCPPMVFSGEKNCWPDAIKRHLYGRFLPSESPWRFLNAGTWMAQIGYLQDSIEKILDFWPDEQDDQRMWTDALVTARLLPGAIVDTERLIFQTMWETELSEVESPCVVHFNGGVWRNPEDRRYIDHWEKVKAGR